MAEQLPFTGVELKAAGLSDYLTSLARASTATTSYERAVASLTEQINKSSLSDTEKVKRTTELGDRLKNVQVAVTQFNNAVASGNLVVMASAAQQVTVAVQDMNRVLNLTKQTVEPVNTLADHFRSLSTQIGSSRVGVGLFVRDLVQLTGASANSTQAIESFVFATGTGGVALGVLAGALTLVANEAQKSNEKVRTLQSSLEQYSKANDAAQALAQLTGTTQDVSQQALEFARAVPAAADSLKDLIGQTQQGLPVLQGFGDLIRDARDLAEIFSKAIADTHSPLHQLAADLLLVSPQLQAFVALIQGIRDAANNAVAGVAGINAMTKALKEGKDPLQAYIAGVIAAKDAQAGNTHATQELKDKTIDYASAIERIGSTSIGNFTNKVIADINRLIAAGATIDAAIAQLSARQGREGVVEAPARNEAEAAREAFAGFQQAVLASEHQLSEGLASARDERNNRLNEITERGKTEELRIIRDYNQRIAEIEANLTQELTDAWSDYQTRLGEINTNAGVQSAQRDQQYSDRREQILQTYADRRESIEQQYQDRIKDIQATYALSFFEAESKRDAKAIIQARMQRDRGLESAKDTRDRELDNAQKTRDRELEAARKSRERAAKDEADALERQRKAAKDAYDKRIRDLEQAAEKQRKQATQNETDQLSDLTANLKAQRDAENASYNAQIARLKRANTDRLNELSAGLAKDKTVTEEWGEKIIKSLDKILSPEQLKAAIKKFHDAFNLRFSVDITSIGHEGEAHKQYGGLTTSPTLTMLSEGSRPELTLPLSHPSITQNLINNYLPASYSLPAMGGGRGGGARQVEVRVTGDIKMNEPLLDGKILVLVDGHVAHVFDSVTGKLP